MQTTEAIIEKNKEETTEAIVESNVLVLNYSDTFQVFNELGDILPNALKSQGLFHKDTRFLSSFALKINDYRPVLLNSGIREDNEIFIANLTNDSIIRNNELKIPEGSIHLKREKITTDGSGFEKILISNYTRTDYHLRITFEFNADFADIFEVRGMTRQERGKIEEPELTSSKSVVLKYSGLDNFSRETCLCFSPTPKLLDSEKACYDITLHARESFEIDVSIFCSINERSTTGKKFDSALRQIIDEISAHSTGIADLATSNDSLNHWINRSKADLISLLAKTPLGPYPYAGVPWYNTAFGRDGILTAYEVLWAAPSIAKGVLKFLAKTQATTVNPDKDAEPGKILHETRNGEMVELNEVPFKDYYGSLDATPLFVFLAGEYYKRTADLETIKEIWPNINAALHWINEHGDLDNDGFAEYQHKAENGLTNQGWKDSYDSISYENGVLAEPPIALCEFQGYIYAAKKNASMLAEALNEKEIAIKWKEEAKSLKAHFNDTFWNDRLNCYILALDGKKDPCNVVSSNAGHCFFTEIVDDKYVDQLTETLMSPEMNSGWGIRTLSSKAARYNPMSYHNGSVWPHDTALIAFGLSKYGRTKEALEIFKGLFEAALYMDSKRLPELYCGFPKDGNAPVLYPVACSPQAWAVASCYMVLQACLGLEINALEKQITLNNPYLPEEADHLTIKNLIIGDSTVSIDLRRIANDTTVSVFDKGDKDWKVIIKK
jgi:glycogen debranching enzyme